MINLLGQTEPGLDFSEVGARNLSLSRRINVRREGNNLKISRELLFRNMGMEDEIKSDE